jgi:hypothetical protein
MERERLSEGKPVIGEHPDCICNGDTVTLWDCDCPECREIRGFVVDRVEYIPAKDENA